MKTMDYLTTDSTIFVDERCEFRMDMAGDEAVLRISGAASQCHLVFGQGVAERVSLLLAGALSGENADVENCYMVIPIHARSIPNPLLGGGNSAAAVIDAATR